MDNNELSPLDRALAMADRSEAPVIISDNVVTGHGGILSTPTMPDAAVRFEDELPDGYQVIIAGVTIPPGGGIVVRKR